MELRDHEKVLVGCIYKSPSSDDKNLDALNKLILEIGNMEEKYKHILIMGDFNFPDVNWNTWSAKSDQSQAFVESLQDSYLYQAVLEPTRIRVNQEPSLLDLVITNEENSVYNIRNEDPVGKSDHCVILFDYKCYPSKSDEVKSIKYNYSKADFENLRKELSIDWDGVFENMTTTQMVDTLMMKLSLAMDRHIPKKRGGLKKGKTALSQGSVACIRKKHRLWKKYLGNRSEENYRDYCKARNKVKTVVNNERKCREKEIAKAAKTNSKHFWKYVNSKRKTKSGVSELHVKDGSDTFIYWSNVLTERFSIPYKNQTKEDASF